MVGTDGVGVIEVVEIRLINSGGVEISRMCALRASMFYPYLRSCDDKIGCLRQHMRWNRFRIHRNFRNFTTLELVCLFKVFIILYTGSFE